MKFLQNKKIILSILALVFYGWLVFESGIFINLFDKSMPSGIYKKDKQKPVRGSLAITCLTLELAEYGLQRGYLKKGQCSTGIQPVLKKVMAIEGDTLTFQDDIVKINGEALKRYRIVQKDSQNRPLKIFYPISVYTLKEGEYWLMSDYKPNSWDSRYWGAVPVMSQVKALWIIDLKSKLIPGINDAQ